MVGDAEVVGSCAYLWPASVGGDTHIDIVQGHSMEPTFELGDGLVVKDNSRPHIGDIIVFHIPNGEPVKGQMVVHRIRSVELTAPTRLRETSAQLPTTSASPTTTLSTAPPANSHVWAGSSDSPTTPLSLALARLVAVMPFWPKRRAEHRPEPARSDSREPHLHKDALARLQTELSTIEAQVGEMFIRLDLEARFENLFR